MDEARPAKRARQACEPCRRKKSRCPGERPICSHCQRLGQTCIYASDDSSRFDGSSMRSNRPLESRMETLEAKLDSLIHHIGPTGKSLSQEHSTAAEDATLYQSPRHREPATPFPLHSPSLAAVGHLYVTWCHSQPLVLFNHATFPESLESRDCELQLAVQALSLRFPPAADVAPQRREQLESMAKEARKLAMNRVVDGVVELSTLQTLCILSMINFAHGKSLQAGLDLSIASELAQRLHPGNYLGNPKEFHDCVKAIAFLQQLQAPILPQGKPVSAPLDPGPPFGSHDAAVLGHNNADERPNQDISSFCTQLAAVWKMARDYAASRIDGHQLPPWHPQSDYSTVMLRHLDIDSKVPLKYRYAANKFGQESPEDLQNRRDYWGPWLFLQIMYAAIPCLLNHPFLLSMRLRDFRHTMPQMFIHQSFEHITRGSGWIIFFLDLVEKQGFEISDPSLAHCVVIVATIHLQHSFVEDATLRRKAQGGLEKCLKFLRRMGLIWPSVSVMADNLKVLQESIVGMPTPSGRMEDRSISQQSWSINAQLLWDLLVYERAGREHAAADQSIFGASFMAAAGGSEDVADFDLVGSAGISGHRSVPKENPVYAPEDDGKTLAAVEPSLDVNRAAGMAMGASVEDRLFEGLTGFSEQDSLFLQANDFGRAIDNWLNIDMV